MGTLVEDLLLCSSPDVSKGYVYPANMKERWDIVVSRLGAVKSYIEVKSGPNDLDKTQVESYARQIDAVEDLGERAYIGITYGRRDSNTISLSLFNQYLTDWERRTLIGTELWDYVSGNESFHEQLMNAIKYTANTILHEQSIIQRIENKISSLVSEFESTYGSVEDYLRQLW